MRVLEFEEWREYMLDYLKSHRAMIGRYHDLLRTNANPDREEDFVKRIQEITPLIEHNLFVLMMGEIEQDYVIFYVDDGVPGYEMSHPKERRSVYETDKLVRRMIA